MFGIFGFLIVYFLCFIINFSWIYWTYIRYKGRLSYQPSHGYRGLKMKRKVHDPRGYKNNQEFIKVEKGARKFSFILSAIISLIFISILL